MCLKEPQGLIESTGEGREDVCRVGIPRIVCIVDRLPKRRRPSRPKRLERQKLTTVVDVEIRLSARWRALPSRHCSASRYAERSRGADPDSCRLWRLACWQVFS